MTTEFAASSGARRQDKINSNTFLTRSHDNIFVRRATARELSLLRTNNNRIEASTKVYFAIACSLDGGNDEEVASAIKEQIANNTISDFVVLPLILNSSTAASPPHSILPFGVTNNTLLHHTILEPFSSCHGNGQVSHTHLLPHAILSNNGVVSRQHDDEHEFGNNTIIDIGPETGGRSLTLWPEATIPEVMNILLNPTLPSSKAIADKQNYNIIGRGSNVSHNKSIVNVFLQEKSIVSKNDDVVNAITLAGGSITNSKVDR